MSTPAKAENAPETNKLTDSSLSGPFVASALPAEEPAADVRRDKPDRKVLRTTNGRLEKLQKNPNKAAVIAGLKSLYQDSFSYNSQNKAAARQLILDALKQVNRDNDPGQKYDQYDHKVRDKIQIRQNIHSFAVYGFAQENPQDALEIISTHHENLTAADHILEIARTHAAKKPEIAVKAAHAMKRLYEQTGSNETRIREKIEHQTTKLYRRLAKNPEFQEAAVQAMPILIDALENTMKDGEQKLHYIHARYQQTSKALVKTITPGNTASVASRIALMNEWDSAVEGALTRIELHRLEQALFKINKKHPADAFIEAASAIRQIRDDHRPASNSNILRFDKDM